MLIGVRSTSVPHAGSPPSRGRTGRQGRPWVDSTLPAFTLAEVLVAIGLTSMILAIYASVLYGSFFLRRSQNTIQAANFIQEELDSLRSLPFSELLTRTDGNFLGVGVDRGHWAVATVTAPPSGTRALQMTAPPAAVNGETGLLLLPGNYRANFTFSAKVDVLAASPSGWGGGIVFRYRDAENYYRFRFSNGGIALDKVQQGTVSTIWSQSATYSKDTWYTLEVVGDYQTITLKKNGASLATVTDYAFTSGDIGLISLSSALLRVDDVSVTENSVTTSWNFDASTVGALPDEWQRLGWPDLAGGTGKLTIATYLSDPKMKQATVTITWLDSGTPHAQTGTSLYIDE